MFTPNKSLAIKNFLSKVIPDIAFDPDINGVCSIGDTLVITSKPTKIASTKTVSEVSTS